MRVMFRRALTRTWLDLEAPVLGTPQVTTTLNEPGDITLELPVEYMSEVGEDGRPILAEWETMVVYEDEWNKLTVGLIDTVVLTGERLTVSAGGLSMQSLGAPWTRPYVGLISADPVVVFRDIWGLLGEPDNALPLWITGDTSSTGRIGKPEEERHRYYRLLVEESEQLVEKWETELKVREKAIETTTKALFVACGLKTVGKIKHQTTGGTSDTTNVLWIDKDDGNKVHVYKHHPARNVKDSKGRTRWEAAGHEWVAVSGVQAQVNAYLGAIAARDSAKETLSTHKGHQQFRRGRLSDQKGGEAEPYEMAWYTTHDLSKAIDDMRDAGPFEWVEWAEWSGSEPSYGLKVGSPRLGRRLSGTDDPRFVLGLNAHTHPQVGITDPYTDVKVYGAGEGSKTLHEYRTWDDGYRVRHVLMLTDKDAKTRDRVKRVADAETRRVQTQPRVSITHLVVVDHPYAMPGTYGLGDEVLFEGTLADGSDVALWLRITEMTRRDGETDLQVETV